MAFFFNRRTKYWTIFDCPHYGWIRTDWLSDDNFYNIYLSVGQPAAILRWELRHFFVPIAIRHIKEGEKKSRLVLTDKPTALHLWRLKMEELHIPGTVNVKLVTLTAHSRDCDCRRKDNDFYPILQKSCWKKRFFQSKNIKASPQRR